MSILKALLGGITPNPLPESKKPRTTSRLDRNVGVGLTLTRLEPALGFVDHIYAAFAAHNTTVAVARFERAKRVLDLHGPSPFFAAPQVLRLECFWAHSNEWWA